MVDTRSRSDDGGLMEDAYCVDTVVGDMAMERWLG